MLHFSRFSENVNYNIYWSINHLISEHLGTVDKVFTLVSCSKGPDDNYKNSFLTIQSKQGLMFGVINIVGMEWIN